MFRTSTYFFLLFVQSLFFISSCGNETALEPGKTDTIKNATDSINESDKILNEIDQKIVADPDNSALYHERAFALYRMGEFERALKDINRCITLDKDFPGFYYTKGEIYYMQLKMDSAVAAFGKAVELNPDYWDAELKMGRIYMYLNNWETAFEHINKALRIEPTLAEAYFMKGEIYEETADTAKAASSFQTAIEMDPEYYDAFIRLGILYAAAHNKLAIDYYNSALKLKPESMEALYNKAKFCQDNGLIEEAMTCYDKIIAIDASFELSYYNKGYILLVEMQDPDAAIVQFNQAIVINPRLTEAFHNRGLAFELKRDFVNARKDYKKALELDPTFELSAQALDNLDRMGIR